MGFVEKLRDLSTARDGFVGTDLLFLIFADSLSESELVGSCETRGLPRD